MARILIVEDEQDLQEVLSYNLRQAGHDAFVVALGQEALDRVRGEPPDLVLLDLMLPDMSGLEILKLLRRNPANSATRVVVLTARRDEVDRVLGFELGADDYVSKPFSPRELVLRVRAVLQRGDGAPAPDVEHLRAGPIEVDLEFHQARVSGQTLDLTLTEFRLLAELMRTAGRVRTRENLLSVVWGYDAEVMSRTVDTHVRRLRSKLGTASAWLDTVRGVGYRIRSPLGERSVG